MKDNKPILHILAPAREGGLERVVEMLALGQLETGVHVACVVEPSAADEHPFVMRLRKNGIPVTPIVVGARDYRGEYGKLSHLVSEIRPRIIHTHGYRPDAMGAFLARKFRLPWVSTVHGFLGGGLRNRVYERLQCLLIRRADAVIAVSRPLIDRLVSSGVPRHKIRLIQNGFAPRTESRTRRAARIALKIDDSKTTAGWIGRLSIEKAPDTAVAAIAKAEHYWTIDFIGDGPRHGALREQVKGLGLTERVALHGEIADAGSLLKAFDVFVLSSRTEGTPIVLLEAMHAEVPIIATAVGGVPDVVSDAEAILVPADDPDAIAAGLKRVRDDPGATSRRVGAAKQRVDYDFATPRWLQRVADVYADVSPGDKVKHRQV